MQPVIPKGFATLPAGIATPIFPSFEANPEILRFHFRMHPSVIHAIEFRREFPLEEYSQSFFVKEDIECWCRWMGPWQVFKHADRTRNLLSSIQDCRSGNRPNGIKHGTQTPKLRV